MLEMGKAKGYEYLELVKKLPKKRRNSAVEQVASRTDRPHY